MIRKALKYNVRVRNIEPTGKYIDMYYDMLIDTFARRKAKPFHSKKVFEILCEALYPDHLKLLLSEVDGNIASMAFFLYNKYQLYYLSGASLPEFNRYAVNNLLHWKIILFAIENGISYYDMGGKGIPSIDKFKESFGGEVVRYPILEKDSIFFKMLKRLYTSIRLKTWR